MSATTYYPAKFRETAVSIAYMVTQSTGSKTVRAIFQRGTQHGLLLYSCLPCRAKLLCDATNNAYGNALELLAAHTLFDFAVCGMSPPMAEQTALNLAFGESSRTPVPRLLPGLECGNRSGLRCPECARSVGSSVKRTVSLCVHCIPYVTRCPWHGCRLICANECSQFEMLMSCEGDDARAANALRYAQTAYSISEDLPHVPLWPRIVELLDDKGFVTERGQLRLNEFHTSLRKLYSAGFEDTRLSHTVDDRGVIERCVRAARRDDRAAPAPVLTLLYCAALDLDAASSSHESHPHLNPVSETDVVERDLKRAQWLAYYSTHSQLTRTQVRMAMYATWTWLYRRDRDWLEQHQHEPLRPPGGRTLHEIPSFIDAALASSGVDAREHPGGREPLPSAYQVRLAWGVSDYLFHRLSSGTTAWGREAQIPGAKEVFVGRRLDYAIKQLSLQGKPLNFATVARTARLRIPTVREFGFKISSTTTTTNDTSVLISTRCGSSHSQRGDVHAVSTAPPNGLEAQSFTASRLDASKSDAPGHQCAAEERGVGR